MKKVFILTAFLLAAASVSGAVEKTNDFMVLNVEGIIDAANSDYVKTGIETARKKKAEGVIIRLYTPGGMMKSMNKIVDSIIESKVPVITYVSPEGANAASAGTFILLASHVAAMAENTRIGTASPIDLKGNKAAEKITNDSIAQIKNLARMRGRNEAWAEKAITENLSSSETEAEKQNVIDIIAPNIKNLMKQIDGMKVTAGDKEITINTENYSLTKIALSPRHKFLHYLADPNISYILFLVGTYGLIYELANPGALFPGIAGGISLVLAFIGFESIPINIAGIVLIILAIVLFIAEAMSPTFGALTVGGVVSLTIGSVLLFPAREAGSAWAPSYWVIGGMVLLTTLVVGVVLMLVIKAHRKRKMTGQESLKGAKGVAETEILEKGVANVGGEEWQAYSDEKIEKRDIVEVLEVNGMKLKVKKIPRKKEEE